MELLSSSPNLFRRNNHLNFTLFIISNTNPNFKSRTHHHFKKFSNKNLRIHTSINHFYTQIHHPLFYDHQPFSKSYLNRNLHTQYPILQRSTTNVYSHNSKSNLCHLSLTKYGKSNSEISITRSLSKKCRQICKRRLQKTFCSMVSSSLNEFPNATYSAIASSSGGIHLGFSTVTQVAITAAAVVYGAYLSEGLMGRRNIDRKPDPIIIEGVNVTRYKIFSEKEVKRAIQFATSAHSGQMRKTGEPYITHCIQTAKILAALVPATNPRAVETIVAAILHDIVDDTEKNLNDIKKEFGNNVCLLVEGVSKLSSITQLLRRKRRWNAEQNEEDDGLSIEEFENLRRMTLGLVNDPRVVLIKLADRLHNMRTIYALPHPKACAVAQETLAVWCSLASRLGVMAVKAELEDLCFAVLQPRTFQRLRAELAKIWSSSFNWRQMRRELRKDPDYLSKSFSFKAGYEEEEGEEESWNEEELSMEDLLNAVIPFDVLLERRNTKAKTLFSNSINSNPNYKNILKDSQTAISALIACEEVLAQELLISTSYIPGMEITLSGRLKSLYSTHSKMKRKKTSVDKVFDARALRVVIGDDDGRLSFSAIECCYSLLSDIHNLWTPINGEYDDYIINPKPSGYQSLHTAVIGPDGAPLEIQIRTKSMHDYAEFGHAAHWLYKEADAPLPSSSPSSSSFSSFSPSKQSPPFFISSSSSPSTSLSSSSSSTFSSSPTSSLTSSTPDMLSPTSKLFPPYSISSDSLSLRLSTNSNSSTTFELPSSLSFASPTSSSPSSSSTISITVPKSQSLQSASIELDNQIHPITPSTLTPSLASSSSSSSSSSKDEISHVQDDVSTTSVDFKRPSASNVIIIKDKFLYNLKNIPESNKDANEKKEERVRNEKDGVNAEMEGGEDNVDMATSDFQQSIQFEEKSKEKSNETSKEKSSITSSSSPAIKVGHPALRILGAKLLNAVVIDIEENGKRLLVATHFGFSAKEIMCCPRSVNNRIKWSIFATIYNTVSEKWWHSPGHGDFEVCLERFKLCKDGVYHLEDHFGRALKTFLQPVHLSEEEEREYDEVMRMVKEGKEIIEEEEESQPSSNTSSTQPSNKDGEDSKSKSKSKSPSTLRETQDPSSSSSSSSTSSSVNRLNNKVRLLRSMLQWEQEIRHESVPNGSVITLHRPSSSNKSKPTESNNQVAEKESLESLSSDILVVLWPGGEIISMAHASTALDAIKRFGRGSNMVWVNGKVALHHTVLKDGDLIEIRR